MKNERPENLSKEELVSWAEDVRSACAEFGDVSAEKAVKEAIDNYQADSFVFSVMGLAKRGKSTLVNALLGRHDDVFAPIGKRPATSVCTIFRPAEKQKITVVFRNGEEREIAPEDLRSYATEDHNRGNVKEVALIRADYPFPENFQGITLVDLPGAESIHEHHDQVVHQFLPQSDAVLLMTTSRIPISAGEIDLLKEVRKNDVGKIFVAMNKIDKCDDEEIAEGEAANRRALAETDVPVGTIYKISAKLAHEGKAEESGVPAMLSDIKDFVEKNRGAIMKKRLVARVLSAAQGVLRAADVNAAVSSLSPDELQNLSKELEIRRDEFAAKNATRRKEFKSRWDGAVDEFAARLPKIKTNVQIRLEEKMNQYGLTSVGKFKKEVPSFFAETIESELSEPSHDLENRLRDLTYQYDKDCPCISIAPDGTVVSESRSHGAEAAMVGVGATLAVGGGLFATVAGGLTTTVLTAKGAFGAYLAANLAGTATSVGSATLASEAVGVASLFSWGGGTIVTPTISSALPNAIVGAGGAALEAAGTSTVPTFLATVAGPIGWTIAGVGMLAVSVAWGFKRNKDLQKLKDSVKSKVDEAFASFSEKQIPALRNAGTRIVEELECLWERQLADMEASIRRAVLDEKKAEMESQALACKQRFNALLPLGENKEADK